MGQANWKAYISKLRSFKNGINICLAWFPFSIIINFISKGTLTIVVTSKIRKANHLINWFDWSEWPVEKLYILILEQSSLDFDVSKIVKQSTEMRCNLQQFPDRGTENFRVEVSMWNVKWLVKKLLVSAYCPFFRKQ